LSRSSSLAIRISVGKSYLLRSTAVGLADGPVGLAGDAAELALLGLGAAKLGLSLQGRKPDTEDASDTLDGQLAVRLDAVSH
jgi:hypothetical protein